MREARGKGSSPAPRDPAKGSWARPVLEWFKGAGAELDAGGGRQRGEERPPMCRGVWAIGPRFYVKAPQ